MVPHATGWIILGVIALIAIFLALAAIDWVMKGYQYENRVDDDPDGWFNRSSDEEWEEEYARRHR
jgi:nitrogen fixation-related uncharacterized protein